MKILVLTPVGRSESGEWIDYFPSRWSYTTGEYKQNSYYPYNLAYLTAYLKRETSHEVKMIDPNYYGVDTEEYISIVNRESPDALIIEVDAIVARKQISIIERIRALGYCGKIILCGPYPSNNAAMLLRRGVDFVAVGEFEESIVNLVRSNFSPDTLGIYPNGRGPLVALDTLPFPEDEDIRRKHYNRIHSCEFKELEMYATRGCPYMCDFCVAVHVYYGKPSFRVRDPKLVTAEIKYLKKNVPELEGIFFNEDSHTINKKFTGELCDTLIADGLSGMKFECMANYADTTRPLLHKMKTAGYYKMRVGIESLEYDSLNFIRKNKDDKLLSFLYDCADLGIKVWTSLSVGTSGSTYEKDMKTLDNVEAFYARGLIQDFSVSINQPLPGTPFYDKCTKEGLIINSNHRSFDGLKDVMIETTNYSEASVRRAFERACNIRNEANLRNRQKGVVYSAYDREWCKEVYATTQRKAGEGIFS
jgi:anaerobic magnesium-protoporphyrin IX monomethyl ester cyclase